MRDLRELQERFYATLVRPHGTPPYPTVVRLVAGGGRLAPEARLEIYARMYCARIVEALAEDFPRVVSVVGGERFDALAHAYLHRWPSTHPSLRYAGRHFADFLAAASDESMPPFLADLARLEWTRLEVFDVVDAPALTLDDLRRLAPERWGTLRLRCGPALRVIETRWPVHELWAAADARGWDPDRRPAATAIRVWRKEFAVYQAPMDETEQAALDAMGSGATFGGICERLAWSLGGEQAAQEAAGLLLRWIEDGILAGPPEIEAPA